MIDERIPETWSAFQDQLGARANPVTEADYEDLLGLMDHVLDSYDITEAPYNRLFDYLASVAHQWELSHQPELKDTQDVPPHHVLAFLMEQQGITQYQLGQEGIASQGNLSRILSGERGISKELAKKLAKRFRVDVGVFI